MGGRPGHFCWAIVLLVGTLIAHVPAAVAEQESAAASFITSGPTTLPHGSRLTLDPLALFLPDTTQLQNLTLILPEVRVYHLVRQDQYADAGAGIPDLRVQKATQEASWTLTNAVVQLAGEDHRGFFGLYPGDGAKLWVTVADGGEIEPRRASTLSDRDQQTPDSPRLPYYHQQIMEKHLFLTTRGSIHYTGPGAAKLLGPDVRLSASENTTTIETGKSRSGDAPAGETHTRMLYLEWNAGEVCAISEAGAFQAAGSEVPEVMWNGRLLLTPTEGRLRAGGTEYDATGAPAVLDGNFTGSLVPALTQQEEAVAILQARGAFRETTLIPVQSGIVVPDAMRGNGISVWLIVGALGIVAGTGVGLGVSHRLKRNRKAPPPEPALFPFEAPSPPASATPSPKGPLIPHGDERGMEWLEKASRLVSTDLQPLMDEAWQVAKFGDIARALDYYDEAGIALPEQNGAANLAAAVLHIITTGNLDLAGGEVEVALDREPGLVWEVQMAEDLFQPLFGRPYFERAMRNALNRSKRAGPREK